MPDRGQRLCRQWSSIPTRFLRVRRLYQDARVFLHQRRMSHSRRMRNESLNAAQALSEGAQLNRFEHNTAPAREPTSNATMPPNPRCWRRARACLGMRRRAWVVNFPNFWVFLEKRCNGPTRLIVLPPFATPASWCPAARARSQMAIRSLRRCFGQSRSRRHLPRYSKRQPHRHHPNVH